MKALLTILTTILISHTVFSQTDSLPRLKPVAKNWGLTFSLTNFIEDLQLQGNSDPEGNPMLFFRRYLKDDLALRLGFGFSTTSNKTIRKDSINLPPAFVEFDSLFRKNVTSISLGFEKHVGKLRRIDPYFGAEVKLRFIGKEQISWNRLITESTGTTTVKGEKKIDGGTGFGIAGIAGVNYFFTKNISIGGEYTLAYDYIKTGGNFSESVITTPPTGSSSSIFTKGTDQRSESGFYVSFTPNIVLSIFF